MGGSPGGNGFESEGGDDDTHDFGLEGGHCIIVKDDVNLLNNDGRFDIPSHDGAVPRIPPIPPLAAAHVGVGDSTTSSGDITLIKQEQHMA